MLVIGADVGGTGARAALVRDGQVIATKSVDGISDRVDAVKVLVGELLQGSKVDAVAVGATGYFMRGQQMREQLPGILIEGHGARHVVLCSDMLSGYVGALGLSSGAVVAAGTGAVALGSDLSGTWKRVDGWGYLLGDLGGGSWIGRTALQAALRAADGRPGGSPALLAALHGHFGKAPGDLVAELAEREDRAGMMAGFVPVVEATGDDVSRQILDEAGAHLAQTAVSALVGARVVATTGNLFQVRAVRESFTKHLPEDVELRAPKGSGVEGALALANAAMNGKVPVNAPCEQFTAP